jgi:hypothetical protein
LPQGLKALRYGRSSLACRRASRPYATADSLSLAAGPQGPALRPIITRLPQGLKALRYGRFITRLPQGLKALHYGRFITRLPQGLKALHYGRFITRLLQSQQL